MRVWLDDLRLAPDGWTWVTTVAQAIELPESGQAEELSLDHELYSAAAGGWQQRPDLPEPRFDATAVSVGDGRLFVAGGQEGHAFSNRADIYAPAAGGWQPASQAPLPFAEAVAAVATGYVGFAGGVDATDPAGVDTGIVYAIVAGRWVLIDRATARLRPAAYGRRPVLHGQLTYMLR